LQAHPYLDHLSSCQHCHPHYHPRSHTVG
jgi:hypothetical protein